ncbi:MAG TPA: PEP-CTERM sorting domain-containing protein [Tepidisphaeraceae bacterium]
MIVKSHINRRLVVLAAAVGAVALSGLTARAQNIIINDDFNDGDLTTNTGTGVGGPAVGTGWTPTTNFGPVGTEINSAFVSDPSTDAADYQLQGISSKNGFDFWNTGGATVQFVTRNATVTLDKSNSTTQFRGGQFSDFRQELGIVGFRRSNTDTTRDELYTNTSGGLYITLFYDGNGSGDPKNLVVTGNLRAVSNQKTANGDSEATLGLETIATFTLNGYDGQSDLLSTLHVNNTGFSLGFDKPVTWTVTEFVGPSIQVDGQGRLIGNYSDFNDAAFTSDLSGEFNNKLGADAFIWAHGADVQNGRGSGELSSVVVNAAQVSETPPPDQTFFSVAAGDWATAANWSVGTPVSVQTAIIDNNGTVTLSTADATAKFVRLGSDSGLAAPVNAAGRGGTLIVQAGADLKTNDSIQIGQANGGTGTFTMSGGTVSVLSGGLGDFVVGDAGTGTAIVSGGNITAADEIIIGSAATGSGALDLSAGTMKATARNFLVGLSGSGQLTLSGTGAIDTNVLYSSLNASSKSTLTMTGGSITAKTAVVIGTAGSSTLTHSAGSITVPAGSNGDMVVGDAATGKGTYNLSGTGSVTVADDFFIARSGGAVGVVNMTGGIITAGDEFWMGENANATGSLNISGGSVTTTARNMLVGSNGTGNISLSGSGSINTSSLILALGATGKGNVNQSGGTMTVRSLLSVARGGLGTYTQTGGKVDAQSHAFMGDFDNSFGTYIISGGTLAVTGNLNVGAALASNAAPDATRTLTGGQALNARGSFIVSGSGGTINVGGHLRANPLDRARTGTANQSNLGFEIFDASGNSTINVAQNADLDGAVIDVDLMNGYAPAAGTTYNLITAAAFGATGTGSTNANGSTGMKMTLHTEDVGQVALAVLPNGTTSQTLKAGAGNRITVSSIRGNNATIIAGTVRVQPNGTTAGITHVNTLSIATGAALDLTNNDLIVENGNFATIIAKRWEGYRDSPDSNATGIISSAGQTITGAPILAVFDNSVAHFGDWPFGSGETVGPAAVLGQFAYIGDADLNGQVTPDDYGAIDSNLGQHVGTAEQTGGMNWFAGDWNFDGDITPDDYGAVDANLGNGQTQGPQLASNGLAANGLAAVPEPASLGLLGVAGAGMLMRRRRNR